MSATTAPGVLSKDAKLEYNSSSTGTASYTEITDLQSIPSLGGTYERVEVTTLADAARRYINGIKNYDELAFVFLYDNSASTSNYRVAKGLENVSKEYKVTLPDGTAFAFTGQASVALDSVGVNAPLTFTMTIALNSDITVTNPQS